MNWNMISHNNINNNGEEEEEAPIVQEDLEVGLGVGLGLETENEEEQKNRLPFQSPTKPTKTSRRQQRGLSQRKDHGQGLGLGLDNYSKQQMDSTGIVYDIPEEIKCPLPHVQPYSHPQDYDDLCQYADDTFEL